MMIVGSHDPYLVCLSIIIAVFASFTGLSLARRLGKSAGRFRTIWLAAAATALGGGIWSMHFVAMLAFHLPGVDTSYDPIATIASLVIAVAFTGGGLAIGVSRASHARIILAGLFMGTGVLAMHYLGMAAMQMGATIQYSPVWVGASAVIAIGASIVAVWLAFRDYEIRHRIAASVAMGAAISGMHYIGMRGAVFQTTAATNSGPGDTGLGHANLAVLIALFSLTLLLFALGAARLEQVFKNLERREARVALRLQIADLLRGGNTIAALDEVAALMGRHFNVTRTGYGLLDPVEDYFDYDICWTDGTVTPLIGRYPAAAFGEKIVAALAAGETVVVEDLMVGDISSEDRTRETAREVDTRSILVVPFVRDGRLRTIVYLNDRFPRRWDRDDIEFMEELAERTRLVFEREAVENQLRELNETLEQRVELRTQELRQAQDALLQSQKMEAVGQLVAGLAHDFNNVLGAVLGAFSLIQRRADDVEKVRHFADAGLQAAERGAKLTAQLLSFSRSHKIQLQPLYVCDVIHGIQDMLKRTLGPMIQLKQELNPHPVPVLADAIQVEMMVLNLAINARDAMIEGGELTITTCKQSHTGDPEISDGDYVEIAVRDTGAGMDAETLRRAMEPFFTTKPVGKGTGLGLAQIYGSARQAGGTVRIESSVGKGTIVRVLLPCTEATPAGTSSSPTEEGRPEGSSRAHILLVDDDEHMRSLLRQGLEEAGHDVTATHDGKSALEVLDAIHPQIAVIDFAMPGMTGVVLAEKIGERIPGLPIIFVSGYADTDSIKNASSKNTTFLQKPFELERLLEVLDKTLVMENK